MPENNDKLRLGGMALRNGLLVHGPEHWAAAVRRDDSSLAVGSIFVLSIFLLQKGSPESKPVGAPNWRTQA